MELLVNLVDKIDKLRKNVILTSDGNIEDIDVRAHEDGGYTLLVVTLAGTMTKYFSSLNEVAKTLLSIQESIVNSKKTDDEEE